MNSKLIIFLSLLSLNTFAQDCGDIKDGTVSRLDQPGKSLGNARVQDQDGLGTCYANTASLMLQSILPNNPEISYLHLSINRAEKLVQKDLKSQGKTQAFKDNGDLLLDAGFACESIKLAKEAGGVCARSDVALEQMMFKTDLNQFSDPGWVQLDLLKKVSAYYDGMLRDFSDRKGLADGLQNQKPKRNIEKQASGGGNIFKRLFGIRDEDDAKNTEGKGPGEKNERFEEYKRILKKVIDDNRDQYAKKKCEKTDTTNALKISENLMMRIQNNLNAKKYKKFPETKYKLFQLKMGYAFNVKVNNIPSVDIKLNDNFKKSLEENYLKKLIEPGKKPMSAIDAFKDTLYKTDPAAPKKMIDELVAEMSADDKAMLDQDYKRYVEKDYSSCAPKSKLDYLKNEDGLIKDFEGTGCANIFMKHVKNLQQMVIGLDKYNFDNIDRLNDFIANLPNLSYDQAMMQLLAPSCSDDKKIKIPNDVSCVSKSFHYPGDKNDDEATTNRHLATMRDDFKKDSLRNIMNNRAVGLSMCTGFYSSETPAEFYNKTDNCDKTKKHGFHAVTMIGYKCDKGKMKYLIQNSWGAWDSANDRFEKDSHGKAWMNEDDLIKNTYQLDMME